jgi:hypothetical protein
MLLGNNTRAGQSCCDRTSFSVLEFGFQLDSLAYTYTVEHIYNKFQPPQNSICARPSGT